MIRKRGTVGEKEKRKLHVPPLCTSLDDSIQSFDARYLQLPIGPPGPPPYGYCIANAMVRDGKIECVPLGDDSECVLAPILLLKNFITQKTELPGDLCTDGKKRIRSISISDVEVVVKAKEWSHGKWLAAYRGPERHEGEILKDPSSQRFWIAYKVYKNNEVRCIPVSDKTDKTPESPSSNREGIDLDQYFPKGLQLHENSFATFQESIPLKPTHKMEVAVEAEGWNHENFFADWEKQFRNTSP